MQVICLEESAFYNLIEQVVARHKENNYGHDKWLSAEAAMKLLDIKSRAALRTLREQGKIHYLQAPKQAILYERDSLIAHAHQQNSGTPSGEERHKRKNNTEPDPGYLKGFNEGYLLSKYQPDLVDKLKRSVKPNTERLSGFLNGANQLELEKEKILRDWLFNRSRKKS